MMLYWGGVKNVDDTFSHNMGETDGQTGGMMGDILH